MIGGSGEKKTLRTVAKYADMWNAMGPLDVMAHKVDVLKRHCDEVGRDIDEIEFTLGVKFTIRDIEGGGGPRLAGRDGAQPDAAVRGRGRRHVLERDAGAAWPRSCDRTSSSGSGRSSREQPAPYDVETLERFIGEVKPLIDAARVVRPRCLPGALVHAGSSVRRRSMVDCGRSAMSVSSQPATARLNLVELIADGDADCRRGTSGRDLNGSDRGERDGRGGADARLMVRRRTEDRPRLLERRQPRRVADRRIVDGVLGDDVQHRVIEAERAQRRALADARAGTGAARRSPAAAAGRRLLGRDRRSSATPTSASSRSRRPGSAA